MNVARKTVSCRVNETVYLSRINQFILTQNELYVKQQVRVRLKTQTVRKQMSDTSET